MKGRPPFIPRDAFRAFLPASKLNRLFLVGESLPTSFARKVGIPATIVDGVQRWRPIVLVARASAMNLPIKPPMEHQFRGSVHDAKNRLADLEKQLVELNEKTARAQHQLIFGAASMALTGGVLLTENAICAAARPQSDHSGVYFLVNKGAVVYVGQSTNVFARVASHLVTQNKVGCRWAFIPTPVDQLNVMESLYIHMLRPELNGRTQTGELVAPLTIAEIVRRAADFGQPPGLLDKRYESATRKL